MNGGETVDSMQAISYSRSTAMWNAGLTLEVISGDWAPIKQEQDWGYPVESGTPPQRTIRKKVELIMLRASTPTPQVGNATRERLPEAGAGVMFRVPNSIRNEWAFGLVLQPNKKSIKVLHDGKFINRNFDQFIEVLSESR